MNLICAIIIIYNIKSILLHYNQHNFQTKIHIFQKDKIHNYRKVFILFTPISL